MKHNFTLAFSTLGCTESSLTQIFETAREFQIDAVELRGIEGEMHMPAKFADRFGDPKLFARFVKAAGRKIVSIDSSFKLLDADDKSKSALLEFVPWCEACGVPRIRVFDGGSYTENPDPEKLDRSARTADWWTDLRDKEGWKVDIMVETHDLLCSADNCLAFLSRCKRRIPVLWDSHHSWFKAGEPLRETWSKLRTHICHIHMRDSIEVDEGKRRSALPGTGSYPLNELLNMLEKDSFNGVLSLEWLRKWEPDIPPLRDALSALRALLDNPVIP